MHIAGLLQKGTNLLQPGKEFDMKRSLFIILALCFAMGLMATGVAAEDTHSKHCICGAEHSNVGLHSEFFLKENNWIPVSDTNGDGKITCYELEQLQNAKCYYLTDDAILEKDDFSIQGWTIQQTDDIYLCLNGYDLICPTGTTYSNMIYIGQGAELNITDCHSGDEVGKITGSDKTLIFGASGASFFFYNGVITGNNVRNNNLISMNDAPFFEMYGGNITENTSSDDLIYLSGSGLRMFAGEISNNEIKGYSTVRLSSDSYMSMFGGKIVNNAGTNYAFYSHIYLNSGCTLTLMGGEISGNTSASTNKSSVAGIDINSGTLNVEGTPVVKNNKTTVGERNIKLSYTESQNINIGAEGLKDGASLGITPYSGFGSSGVKVTTEAAADYAKYFFSDMAEYEIIDKEEGGKHFVMLMQPQPHTVYFQGADVAAQTVKHGEKATKPADPTQTGFTFAGWYTDNQFVNAYDFDAPVTANVYIWAKWDRAATPTPDPDAPCCASKCPVCGGCLDKACTDPACAAKCTADAVSFTDVSKDDWFYNDVITINHSGVMVGVGDNKFDPYGVCTRAMMITMLWRMEGEPTAAGGNGAAFSDVPKDEWYTDAVSWGASHEIIVGYQGKYLPNDTITREEMAAILYRYTKMKGKDVSAAETASLAAFTDADEISDWAVPAVKWAVGNGIIKGNGNNDILPLGGACRAEAAAMLNRMK